MEIIQRINFSPFQFIGRAGGLDWGRNHLQLAYEISVLYTFAIMIPDELPTGSLLTWTEDA